MESDNEELSTEDVLNMLGDENREEKLYKLLEYLTKDRLIELKEKMRIKCKVKCITPLRRNNGKNVKELYKLKKENIPMETCNLLNQSYMTIKTVQKLIKSENLVDSNTLLRSAFENLIMGMMIFLNSNVYDEFIKLGLKDDERIYTKPIALRKMFRKSLKVIDKDTFGDMSNTQMQKLLDEFYDKLCLFTHSTLIVNEMVEAIRSNDEDLFLIAVKQNIYFLEILLNCCLRYITKDKSNPIKYDHLFVGWYILVSDIDRNKYTKEYLSKYNSLLYENINKKYLDKNNNDVKILLEEMKKLDEVIKENPVGVIELLEEILK